MPRKILPRITSVKADGAKLAISITWQDGTRDEVNVGDLLGRFKSFAVLRRNQSRFAEARVGEFGTDVEWPDGEAIAAVTLWRLAQEQKGQTMSAEAFRDWRKRSALTLDGAASALGLSRRMVAYYEDGEKPVPRVVALATKGLEVAG